MDKKLDEIRNTRVNIDHKITTDIWQGRIYALIIKALLAATCIVNNTYGPSVGTSYLNDFSVNM